MDFLDALDSQDIARGLLGEFVSAVRGTDGDSQRVALRLLDEIGGLFNVSEQLLTRHVAFGTVAILLVALHRFERTEYAQFTFD